MPCQWQSYFEWCQIKAYQATYTVSTITATHLASGRAILNGASHYNLPSHLHCQHHTAINIAGGRAISDEGCTITVMCTIIYLPSRPHRHRNLG